MPTEHRNLTIRCETYEPGYSMRDISVGQVPELYHGLGAIAASFTWNDGGDEVLIVGVGSDYSTATILRDRSFYDLEGGAGDGFSAIELAGDVVDHPDALILDRGVGLDVLMMVPDFRAIVDGYRWRVQD